MRIRKNVKHLTDTEKTNFVNAVLALKKKESVLHPNDPNRSRYDDYPEVHLMAMMAEQRNGFGNLIKPGWAHNAPAFFPWHREMILQFENDLVAIDPTVTLPYWDWTDTDPEASPFNDFLGGNGQGASRQVMDGPFAQGGSNAWTIEVKDNPGDPDFLQRSFGTDQTAVSLPSAMLQGSILHEDTYDASPWMGPTNTFRSRVEYELHNLVHRYVGGTMGKMSSPNDPVFFLHHANIDRLWASWQIINPSATPYLPLTGATQGHNLDDQLIFNMPGDTAPFNTTATPADVIDNIPLGYTYDELSVYVPKIRIPLSYARILFGIINDAPGAWIGPDGKIHHEPGGPGDPAWQRINAATRDVLVARAIDEVAGLLSASEIRIGVQKAAAPLAARAGRIGQKAGQAHPA